MSARVVVAGTHSGCGKTTVACGLMAALAGRGLAVAPFKVGPDYIDPSYHRVACGRPGRNLDAYLSGPDLIVPLFEHGRAGADVSVIEGVMGMLDGASGAGELASTAQVAKLLRAPVILVVDAGAMARSVAALVHGYASFDRDVAVVGVVLNRVASDWHEELLRDALAPLGIPIVGVLRRRESIETPGRHLGLVPAAEREAHARRTLDELASIAAGSLDLDAIVRLARAAPAHPAEPWTPPPATRAHARIAIAAGPAFSFRYEENLELLRAAGAELLPFDPLADEALPLGTQAVYLGGGFPEVHADELAANWALRAELAAFARAGRPVVAECGGLLYLARELDGRPMCGVVDAAGALDDQLVLGYRHARATAGSAAYAAGTEVRGHEFHYGTLSPAASDPPAWRLDARGRSKSEGFATGSVHASFLHVHWAAFPEAAARLVAAAAASTRRAA